MSLYLGSESRIRPAGLSRLYRRGDKYYRINRRRVTYSATRYSGKSGGVLVGLNMYYYLLGLRVVQVNHRGMSDRCLPVFL